MTLDKTTTTNQMNIIAETDKPSRNLVQDYLNDLIKPDKKNMLARFKKNGFVHIKDYIKGTSIPTIEEAYKIAKLIKISPKPLYDALRTESSKNYYDEMTNKINQYIDEVSPGFDSKADYDNFMTNYKREKLAHYLALRCYFETSATITQVLNLTLDDLKGTTIEFPFLLGECYEVDEDFMTWIEDIQPLRKDNLIFIKMNGIKIRSCDISGTMGDTVKDLGLGHQTIGGIKQGLNKDYLK